MARTSLTLLLLTAWGFAGREAGAQPIREFPIPASSAIPGQITAGADGALWFTMNSISAAALGRMTTTGNFSLVPLPGNPPAPGFPAAGCVAATPDGSIWACGPNGLIRLSPSGEFFQIPLLPVSGTTAGPDGALWVATSLDVTRIGTDGAVSHFPIPSGILSADAITAGPDGALWLTSIESNAIARLDTSGNSQIYPLNSQGAYIPSRILAGPDGALWFLESCPVDLGSACPDPGIGRITVSGAISSYDAPLTPGFYSSGMAVGPDQSIWLSEGLGNGIGHVTATGTYSMFTIPGAQSFPGGITRGPDGAIWLPELGTDGVYKILRVDVPLACPDDPNTLCLDNGRFMVQAQWTDHQGHTGLGNLVPGVASSSSGLMWFFSPDNWELLIKVLDGCEVNGHYWVFGAAATDVGYTIQVTDTQSGTVKTYTNPLGMTSPAITDTFAFASCP